MWSWTHWNSAAYEAEKERKNSKPGWFEPFVAAGSSRCWGAMDTESCVPDHEGAWTTVNGGSQQAQTSPACVGRWADFTLCSCQIKLHQHHVMPWHQCFGQRTHYHVCMGCIPACGGHLGPMRWPSPGSLRKIPQPHPHCVWFLISNAMLHEVCKEMCVCKRSLFPVEFILKILGNTFIVVMIV